MAAVFPAYGQLSQEGNKLVGTGASGDAYQGAAVAVSADGTTALVGGDSDNFYSGAVWVYTRSSGGWSQQGNKLVPNDATGESSFGFSVALSSDGNSALLGGPAYNNLQGAAWVFTRSDGVWSQQRQQTDRQPSVRDGRTGQLSSSVDGWQHRPGDVGAA
jgi:hypothetical protein